jgi:hypothetical protein
VRATPTDRVEDLEEALRRIVTVVAHDGRHEDTERDLAVLALALDALGLEHLEACDLYMGRGIVAPW